MTKTKAVRKTRNSLAAQKSRLDKAIDAAAARAGCTDQQYIADVKTIGEYMIGTTSDEATLESQADLQFENWQSRIETYAKAASTIRNPASDTSYNDVGDPSDDIAYLLSELDGEGSEYDLDDDDDELEG